MGADGTGLQCLALLGEKRGGRRESEKGRQRGKRQKGCVRRSHVGNGQKPRGECEAESEKIFFFPGRVVGASGVRMELPASPVCANSTGSSRINTQ